MPLVRPAIGLAASPPWSSPMSTRPLTEYTVPSRFGTTRVPVTLAGSWQLRTVLLLIVPTLLKPAGQSAAGPPVGGGLVGGGLVGGGLVLGGGGNAPSPGEATRSAPPPQALSASVAAK